MYNTMYILEERDSGYFTITNLITPRNDTDALAIAKGATRENGPRIQLYKLIYDSHPDFEIWKRQNDNS